MGSDLMLVARRMMEGEDKLVALLRVQAEIYEYLAGKGDDTDGVELAQRFSQLQNEINQVLSTLQQPTLQFTFDPMAGEQLLESISSQL